MNQLWHSRHTASVTGYNLSVYIINTAFWSVHCAVRGPPDMYLEGATCFIATALGAPHVLRSLYPPNGSNSRDGRQKPGAFRYWRKGAAVCVTWSPQPTMAHLSLQPASVKASRVFQFRADSLYIFRSPLHDTYNLAMRWLLVSEGIHHTPTRSSFRPVPEPPMVVGCCMNRPTSFPGRAS